MYPPQSTIIAEESEQISQRMRYYLYNQPREWSAGHGIYTGASVHSTRTKKHGKSTAAGYLSLTAFSTRRLSNCMHGDNNFLFSSLIWAVVLLFSAVMAMFHWNHHHP